jgi:26S proteasome regulatory subunit N1
MKTFMVGKYHYFLYYLCLSIYPRMMIALNDELEPITTQVRVGNAVDTVGQAGKPKKITGFTTHDTPVLIGCNERVELGTEEYLPETNVIENFVILRPNPDYNPEDDYKKVGKK